MAGSTGVAYVEASGEKPGNDSAKRGDGSGVMAFRSQRDYPVGGNLGVLEGL
jgi:hypothetical protein